MFHYVLNIILSFLFLSLFLQCKTCSAPYLIIQARRTRWPRSNTYTWTFAFLYGPSNLVFYHLMEYEVNSDLVLVHRSIVVKCSIGNYLSSLWHKYTFATLTMLIYPTCVSYLWQERRIETTLQVCKPLLHSIWGTNKRKVRFNQHQLLLSVTSELYAAEHH